MKDETGSKKVLWGRKTTAGFSNTFGSLLLIAASVSIVTLNWIALEDYRGSLTATLRAISREGLVPSGLAHLPHFSQVSILGYAIWVLFQGLVYAYLPGSICFGQRTPGGHLLQYTTNGLGAWMMTHILVAALVTAKRLDPALIAKHWEGLFVAANIYGFSLAVFVMIKGYLAPTHPNDRKFSGSIVFDFWAGIELNPRFGQYWDFKLFHNGRPGMVAWTMIDLSFAAYQYQLHGYITKSMLIVLLLHTIYVVDLFYNEAWYTRTPDISHDHFGFMLAWGDTVFLPTFYTLQVQYLARYPVHLSNPAAYSILFIGILGYGIFRAANFQRDHVRESLASGKETIVWGRPAHYISCTYSTNDGKEHSTALLTSGWWGSARHVNYLGDLMQAWAWCATCGFKNVLPWLYFFYLFALLMHRMDRNDQRCKNKYGKKWEQYCAAVPHKLIPGVV